jgi:hypothetical protein
MRFSHVAVVYFMMGILVLSSGVIPPQSQGGPGIGLAGVFVDTDGGNVTANEEEVVGGEGMLDNLAGPIKNALDTVAGGSMLAVWGAISKLLGYYAWPIVVTNHIGAPDFVIMMAGLLVLSFTFGGLRVFRASI